MDAAPLNVERASARERIAVWACALFAAAMRWPAKSLTLWDWDEALFALALRDFDVSAYHPHPPGFPLFIAAAKLVPLDGFHALQTIVFLSSLFVFPAMYLLARALRASVPVAIGAGMLLAFFPNVWFFGGTALSDVPSMVLVVTACALLLRGQVVLGAIVLGIAAGFRPQNLLIGFVPFALSAWRSAAVPAAAVAASRAATGAGGAGRRPGSRRGRRRSAVLAAIVLAAIVITTYGTAAALSGGWSAYREVLAGHEAYIRTTDSFLAPRHPGLIRVADDFFFRPYRAMPINVIVTLLAAIAVLRRRQWMAIAIFGPFCVFAWLMLDFHSSSRFSIAYMPMFAMLAAAGIPRRGYAAMLAVVTALMIVWTWPALRVVHTTPSPPVAAVEAVRGMRGNLYVDHRLGAHADLLLPERLRIIARVAPPILEDRDAILLKEDLSVAPGARNFTRERERLEGIARKRYFETSVIVGRRPTA